MNVYFISGIGADGRIFRNIRLPDGFTAIYLDWIPPAGDEEPLEDYAHRLSASMDPSKPFILVGLSLGGMLATEIAKRYTPAGLILISSIPSARHLPGYYKMAGNLKLHRLVPISLLKSASMLKRLFTAETAEEKKYLRLAIRGTDARFIRWSLNAIINWKSEHSPENYIHIHGSRDALLPVKYTQPTDVIRGGGHLMVLPKAREINAILDKYLVQLNDRTSRNLSREIDNKLIE